MEHRLRAMLPFPVPEARGQGWGRGGGSHTFLTCLQTVSDFTLSHFRVLTPTTISALAHKYQSSN